MIFIGMRYLDFRNKWLDYGQDIIVPFFLLHQPVIIILAYYVVQWETSISLKIFVVVLGSFLITLGLCEFLIRRVEPARAIFGMKPLAGESK